MNGIWDRRHRRGIFAMREHKLSTKRKERHQEPTNFPSGGKSWESEPTEGWNERLRSSTVCQLWMYWFHWQEESRHIYDRLNRTPYSTRSLTTVCIIGMWIVWGLMLSELASQAPLRRDWNVNKAWIISIVCCFWYSNWPAFCVCTFFFFLHRTSLSTNERILLEMSSNHEPLLNKVINDWCNGVGRNKSVINVQKYLLMCCLNVSGSKRMCMFFSYNQIPFTQ